jgi:putative membrane protein
MKWILNLFISLIALLHVGFLILEMFLWTTAAVAENFNLSLEQAQLMAPLAANMGLYNGFLAVGLIWAWFIKPVDRSICSLFLLFIVIAGVYGAITVKLSILFVQALPAAIALLLLTFSPQAEPVSSGSHL